MIKFFDATNGLATRTNGLVLESADEEVNAIQKNFLGLPKFVSRYI